MKNAKFESWYSIPVSEWEPNSHSKSFSSSTILKISHKGHFIQPEIE